VVAKVRERSAVNKQRSHSFHIERFNFKQLNEVEHKEQFHVEILNSFADLEAEVEINSARLTIGENIKISAKESLGCFELGWILERWDEVMWAGLVWLRMATGGELS
jgi:hypothetical protein